MHRPRIRDRFRYWFDTMMARGTIAQIVVLGIASLALVLVSAWAILIFRLYPTGPASALNPSPLEVLWDALVRALSSGSIREDVGWGYRFVMLVVTIGGLVIVAALIGVVSSALDARLREFREGRSQVLEANHTVILGWSSTVIPIARELIEAHRGSRRSSIAVLAPHAAVDIIEQLALAVPERGRTRIVVRSGDPKDRAALEIVSPRTAHSIIVVSPDDALDPDIEVVSIVLALTRNPERKSEPYSVVAELRDPAMLRTALTVSPDEVRWVLADDLIGRITVQSSRHSGLSSVYTALLDFAGDEFYFVDAPSLVGRTYGDAVRAYPTSSVVGVARPDSVELNPSPDSSIGASDRLIVIARDAASAAVGEPAVPRPETIIANAAPADGPERTLLLGYHAGCATMLGDLLDYFPPGSTVTVVSQDPPPPGFDSRSGAVSWVEADPMNPDQLDALGIADYGHLIVVPSKDTLAPHAADARTLVTLLTVRERLRATGTEVPIVSQMMDARNCDLADAGNADDFVVSDRLVSLMLSQISQNPRLAEVFDTLLSAAGSEFYVRPASTYVQADVAVDFYTVVESCLRRGETAIGYRLADGTVVINPDKRTARSFGADDAIIVLAGS